jgi:hypothetical protein
MGTDYSTLPIRPQILFEEDNVVIHVVMQRDTHHTLYYLHAATTGYGQLSKTHYWWSPELSSAVVAEPPPGYQVILSAAGKPLLVPINWLRDDKTLDAGKEAELEHAQRPDKLFSLPKSN